MALNIAWAGMCFCDGYAGSYCGRSDEGDDGDDFHCPCFLDDPIFQLWGRVKIKVRIEEWQGRKMSMDLPRLLFLWLIPVRCESFELVKYTSSCVLLQPF